MDFQLADALEVLSETPAVLNALLRGKSAAWLNCRKTPSAFSPTDVVGHLILADQTNWIPRVRMILEHQDTRPFEPFERFDFQSLIAGKPIEEVLETFAETRRESLVNLEILGITAERLQTSGLHPQFGKVKLSQLLATWTVHDLNHINQIVKTMANEYTEAVGSWRQFLSILN